jgi:hypothetical protein
MAERSQAEGAVRMIGLSVVFFLALGIVLYWSYVRHSTSGKVASTGAPLGVWSVSMDSCKATSLGAVKAFWLSDSDHPTLKMAVAASESDPPQVSVVSATDGETYAVAFDRCGTDVAKAEVLPGSNALTGSVKLDCMVGAGHLTANVSFSNCK